MGAKKRTRSKKIHVDTTGPSCSNGSSCSSSDIGTGDPVHRPLWTFSSSGWLFVYHFGVIKCLKDLNLHRCVLHA